MYMDEFHTAAAPGVLVIHGYGNVFERNLGPGESIYPSSLPTATRPGAN